MARNDGRGVRNERMWFSGDNQRRKRGCSDINRNADFVACSSYFAAR